MYTSVKSAMQKPSGDGERERDGTNIFKELGAASPFAGHVELLSACIGVHGTSRGLVDPVERQGWWGRRGRVFLPSSARLLVNER